MSAALSKFQKFTIQRIDRGTIKGAKYNPRVISNHARKQLQTNLRKVGLLEPVIVNGSSMTLVGGHQRLAALDALEGSPDYLLDVAMVKLTAKQEREQNLFMNNPAAQGEWDLPLLAEMLPGLDLEATGFSEMELETMLGFSGKGVFGDEEQAPEAVATVDDMEAMQAARETEAEAAKGRRQAMREATKEEHEETDTARIGYVVFPNRKERESWFVSLGLAKNERYVPASLITGKAVVPRQPGKREARGRSRSGAAL